MAETVKGLDIKLTLDGKDLENELNGIKKDLKEQVEYIGLIQMYQAFFLLTENFIVCCKMQKNIFLHHSSPNLISVFTSPIHSIKSRLQSTLLLF